MDALLINSNQSYNAICLFSSSMVIRDLTLRSAASFGSFHLIRLLYDEYMFYLVEHKVAAATGETPIAVMGEVRSLVVEPHHEETDFCLGENKGADQLRSNCKADQLLCFRYRDSTTPLLLKTGISMF